MCWNNWTFELIVKYDSQSHDVGIIIFNFHVHLFWLTSLIMCCASSYSLKVFRPLPVPLPACLPAARPTVKRRCMQTINSRGVSTLFASLRHFLPPFVLATCCRAGPLLKAEMLAGYGLCIIDADGDWALRAIGYNSTKSKKVVNSGWTHRVFSRIRRRWRLLKPRVDDDLILAT